MLLLMVPFLSACEENIYTVAFDTDGGTTINKQIITENKKVTKPEDPTKVGYDFVGWTYEDQEWDFDNKVKGNIILKAKYELHNYTVIFNNVDGTQLDKQENLHYGDTVTYAGIEPVYPNPEVQYVYTFKGWDKELVVTDDMVFTAEYNQRNKRFHVKYVDYDGRVAYELYTDEESELPTSCPGYEAVNGIKDNVNYRFLGWDKEEKGEGETIYTAKYDRCSVGLKFNKNIVTGYEGNSDTIYVPSEWEGYEIDTIGENAFKENTALKNIDVPSSVNDILRGAFQGCTALEKIEFKEGLHFIETNAFVGCTALKQMIIPNSIMLMTVNALEGCTSLQYNEYQNGLYLGNASNPYLSLVGIKDKTQKAFVMHDNCETFASSVFKEYTALEDITVSSNIREMGQFGFMYCSKLNTTVKDGAKYIGNATNPYLILVKADTSITSINVQAGCRAIDEEAFMNCKALEEVTLPDSLRHISGMAFRECSKLKAIDIPASVKSLNYFCFSKCTALETVTLHEGLTYIEPDAFINCSALKNIVIPNSVIYIGDSAFSTSGLESITLSNNIKFIKSSVFSSCRALTSIDIPEGVMEINKNAFMAAANLKEVSIPKSVNLINNRAFYMCSKLETITYAGTTEEWAAIEKEDGWNQNAGDFTVIYNGGALAA